MSYNDITGDRIASRVNNKKFSEGWDAIFKKPEPKITPFFDKEKVELINKTGSKALQKMINDNPGLVIDPKTFECVGRKEEVRHQEMLRDMERLNEILGN